MMSDESDVLGVARTLTGAEVAAADPPGPPSQRTHLVEILTGLRSVMMVSSSNGRMDGAHARPMTIARVDADATLYFLTAEDTATVKELRREDVGMCTGQTKTEFVSIEGRFDVIRDVDMAQSLWSKGAEVWFPEGPTDPRVRVIIFRPSAAELWDLSGAKGLNFLLDVAKAWMTGTEPPETREVHAKVLP